MAYEKIGFNKGDVLKAEHLNHMEENISGIKTFHVYGETADDDVTKTFENVTFYQEAKAAIQNRKPVIFFYHELALGAELQFPSVGIGHMEGDGVDAILVMFFFMTQLFQIMINSSGEVSKVQ